VLAANLPMKPLQRESLKWTYPRFMIPASSPYSSLRIYWRSKAGAVLCIVAAILFVAVGRVLATEPTGDLYILSVGFDRHEKSSFDVNAQDASYVRQALVAADPFYTQVHSRLLLGRGATRSAVLESLKWLSDQVRPEDVVIVFFACHGSMTPDGYVISLARANAQNTQLPGIRGTELNDALNKMRGRRIVMLDSCHAGALVESGNKTPATVTLLLSCGATQDSAGQMERPDRPSGFFVIALCEALSGLADANHDRIVTLKEVGDYVPTRAQAFWTLQSAVLVRQPAMESIPLARVNGWLTPQHIWTPRTWRNPFNWPDVPNPDGPDVLNFAKENQPKGLSNDLNAPAWPASSVQPTSTIDGEWFSRWSPKASPTNWSTGKAEVRTVGDRIYIKYEEPGGRKHLIDAMRIDDNTLAGRYADLETPQDSTPWVGRIVNNERIDGQWGNGRWDLRRTFARETAPQAR
jgi:hypothetical protein